MLEHSQRKLKQSLNSLGGELSEHICSDAVSPVLSTISFLKGKTIPIPDKIIKSLFSAEALFP